jgi:beta-aspartyl-peptidase (threonine type)
MQKFTIVIHGGAGTILKKDMTPEKERLYLQGLNEALDAGYRLLKEGDTALNAVKAAVVVLEDNILFNAGKGSVFTNTGIHEMDAAIMEGKNLQAGAVAAIRNIRNPIELAMEVMLKSDHVFMIGEGAIEFARSHGIQFEPDKYFFSQFRFDQWKRMRESGDYALDHSRFDDDSSLPMDKKFGTVGAVALDIQGNLASATSTGGMTNKKFGRIGDTPLIGCGTYANNKTCAISATGHGEPFIRAVAAYDVSCLMEYKGLTLQEGMRVVVFDKLVRLEGEGGLIGVDTNGNAAMLFNSEGMYRGMRRSDGTNEVGIYK